MGTYLEGCRTFSESKKRNTDSRRLNDVQGWKSDIQTQARNKWRYFKSYMKPQINDRIELLSKAMQDLFGFENDKPDMQHEN